MYQLGIDLGSASVKLALFQNGIVIQTWLRTSRSNCQNIAGRAYCTKLAPNTNRCCRNRQQPQRSLSSVAELSTVG